MTIKRIDAIDLPDRLADREPYRGVLTRQAVVVKEVEAGCVLKAGRKAEQDGEVALRADHPDGQNGILQIFSNLLRTVQTSESLHRERQESLDTHFAAVVMFEEREEPDLGPF